MRLPGFREDRRAGSSVGATALLVIASMWLLLAQPAGERTYWVPAYLVLAGVFVLVALVLLAFGYLPPRLVIAEPEKVVVAFNDATAGVINDQALVYRLRVKNTRRATTARGVQVDLEITDSKGFEWSGQAHWRHQDQTPFIGSGELDLPSSERNRRLIDVVTISLREKRRLARESDEGRWKSLPPGELFITATVHANNARKKVSRWKFVAPSDEWELCPA